MKQSGWIIGVLLCLIGMAARPSILHASGGQATFRAAQIERLSPEEREKVKKNYEEYRKLPPEEKNKLKQKYQQFQQAPPEEKDKIRENYRKFENMTPEERRSLEDSLRNRDRR